MGKAKRKPKAEPQVGNLKTDPRPHDFPNPYFNPRHDVGRTNPKTIVGMLNVRESAVETLFSRKVLDRTQKEVADRFRRLWEATGGAGAGALDYAREPVDGGGVTDPISDRLVNAGQQLKACRDLLGARTYDLVCKVCGEGFALDDLTRNKREKLTAADNLRAGLDDLAELWKLKSQERDRRTHPF